MRSETARELLKTGAVFFRPDQPFTWASGIRSPFYCDNRLVLSSVESRRIIEEGMVDMLRKNYPDAEALFGTATAGIAHAAIAAYLMDLPCGYVRSKAKDHGRTNRIEGRIKKGQKIVVVEDLISTGGSCIETAQALKDAGAEVLGVVSIFTYGLEKSRIAFAEEKLDHRSLTDFDALVEVAAAEGYIKAEEVDGLLEFRDSL